MIRTIFLMKKEDSIKKKKFKEIFQGKMEEETIKKINTFKNRNYELSEESLKKSIEMRSNVYESHNHLATVYYATKQLDKAA